jgi:hypothetical protein
MVSKNSPNNHLVSIPADQSLPKISLALLLQTRTVPLNTTRTLSQQDSLTAIP